MSAIVCFFATFAVQFAFDVLPDGRVTETRYTSFGKEDKVVLWKTLADYQGGNDTLARITSYTCDVRGNK